VTSAVQCDIQQNTSHVRQHHIFHIEKWCSYDIQHTPRLLSLFDYHMIDATIT